MYKYLLLLIFFILTSVGLGQDSLFTSISGDTLTIHHEQTERNCGAEFTYDVDLTDNLITITEVDTGAMAFCMCFFDLSVSLTDLNPGTYQIDVWSDDLGNDPIFHGSLDVNFGVLGLISQEESECLATRDDTSFIELLVSGNSLNLFWNTPLLNCGLEPTWMGWLTNDTFHVTMQDSGLPADCVCPFELSASFGSFHSGTYTLDFWNGEYGYPQFHIAARRDGPVIAGGYQSPCYNPTSNANPGIALLPDAPWIDVKCYPNPFNSQISIAYEIQNPEELEILIYDITGSFITCLRSRSWIEEGKHIATWSGIGQQGESLGSGVYLLAFRGYSNTTVNRLILLN